MLGDLDQCPEFPTPSWYKGPEELGPLLTLSERSLPSLIASYDPSLSDMLYEILLDDYKPPQIDKIHGSDENPGYPFFGRFALNRRL